MDNKYIKYVEECLGRLDRGVDLLDVLEDYPDHQDKLKSLLLVAMASRSFQVPVPNHTALRLGKNQMLDEMELMRLQGDFRKSPLVPHGARLLANLVRVYRATVVTRLAPSYRLAMVALVLVMSGGFLTLDAAASSQPGDILYSLKLSMQRVQLALTVSPDSSLMDPDQLAVEIPIEPEYLTARSTNRSIYILHGITFQLNQDGRPGVASVAEAELQAKSSPPSFASAQGNSGQGSEQKAVDEVGEEIGASEEANQGKALGKEKVNPGKSLGLEKNPKEDKNKNK